MTANHSARLRFWALLVGAGCVAACLQGLNIYYLATHFGCTPFRLACPGPFVPWVTNDSGDYVGVAQEILQKGPLHASYLRRMPGYPLLLATGIRLFGQPFPMLWVAPLLGAVAAIAIGWTAFTFIRRTWAAAMATFLFCAWPNAYQYSPLLMTDAVHACLAVTAFAATLAWLQTKRPLIGCLTAGLWMATQLVRPTFFLLPLLLPILLWHKGVKRPYARVSVGIWMATCIVPALIVMSNLVQHGMLIVSTVEPETLALYAVPHIQEEMGLGRFKDLRAAASRHYGSIADVRQLVTMERRDASEFLRAHPWMALRSFSHEIAEQLFEPLEPWNFEYRQGRYLYPARLWPPRGAIYLFWTCAALGLVVIARPQPRVAFFLLLAFFLVMGPTATTHWAGDRLRFPLDLLFIPLVATLLCWLGTQARALDWGYGLFVAFLAYSSFMHFVAPLIGPPPSGDFLGQAKFWTTVILSLGSSIFFIYAASRLFARRASLRLVYTIAVLHAFYVLARGIRLVDLVAFVVISGTAVVQFRKVDRERLRAA
jgi:hypothetical protein